MTKLTPEEYLKNVGPAIRKLRKARGLSQEKLADLCGLDRTYIGGVERSERNVSLLNMAKISCAIGVELSQLLAITEKD